jgi:2-pyrone-4,6-dicarboxylate lactonase
MQRVFLVEQEGGGQPDVAAPGCTVTWWRAAQGQGWRGYAVGDQDLPAPWTELIPLVDVAGASHGQTAAYHYVVETDIPDQARDDFNAWYETEHMPGLARVPGTIRARRYLRKTGGPRYVACYDLLTPVALERPEWLAVRHTPWSDRVRPLFMNTRRIMHARPDIVRTYLDAPSQPSLVLPAKACDAHVHVFGPADRYPYAPQSSLTPFDAPKEKLFALHRRFGIERCVIVQSAVHGLDNSVVEDAIRAGGGNYLGVALAPPDVPDRELRRLADAGFRAVRFNFMKHLTGGYDVQDVLGLAHRLEKVGMHLQVHFQSDLVHTVGRALLASPVPVVIDHMGRVDAAKGADHEDFQALMRLLDHAGMHVKVSGIDRIDSGARAGSGYPMGVKLAAMLVERFPEQCVWGLDWPHPNHTHIPDDGELVDALVRIAPTTALLDRLLVRNPDALYRFPA